MLLNVIKNHLLHFHIGNVYYKKSICNIKNVIIEKKVNKQTKNKLKANKKEILLFIKF